MLFCGLFGQSSRLQAVTPSTNSSRDESESPPTPERNSVDAMMHTIETAPQSLLEFAVTQLNAELILFLRDVALWKRQWTRCGSVWDGPGDIETRVTCYAHAALIYFMLVDEKAPYPLNIHPGGRASLARLFQCAGLASPYSSPELPSTPDSGSSQGGSTQYSLTAPAVKWGEILDFNDTSSKLISQQELIEIQINASEALNKVHVLPSDVTRRCSTARHDSAMDVMALIIEQSIDAPKNMHMGIFDAVVKEVKMQAYHNVWLPFLNLEGHRKARH